MEAREQDPLLQVPDGQSELEVQEMVVVYDFDVQLLPQLPQSVILVIVFVQTPLPSTLQHDSCVPDLMRSG